MEAPLSKPLSQFVRSHQATGIRRFFEMAATLPDVLSLGVGEPEFKTPEAIREAGIRALRDGDTPYSSNFGRIETREAIAEELQTRYGARYDPGSEIILTVGVSEAVDLAVRALVNPGDEVIVPEPNYVSYVPCVRYAGGVPVTLRTTQETDFCPTLEQIEAAITPRTKAIMLSYPCNPSGAIASPELLQGVVALAERHDFYVISDEIYSRLSFDRPHVCVAALPGARERTVLLNGFSKSYAMTGWRLGYTCAPPEITELMMKVHQFTILCAPVPAQIAAISALREAEPEVAGMIEGMNTHRKRFVEAVRAMGLDCPMPPGSFFAFPSVQGTGLDETEFAERLLMEEQVLVIPGTVFGTPRPDGPTPGAGHLRCNFAVHPDKLEEALARMKRFMERLAS